ncbi:holo-ACP synthase [Neptunomonas antarctica]|uniref:Holo-[acyl-carrier-protein] synthase n=1 Tax=Neptunomonas antarctica TaxID=619304 RepID=A0A1N7N0Q4_9GAMM|nr:holo-ACP synthase [Neptunomonas antarctica]SIS91699.1 holo-[acyl-carrier-protein] synthase [Neptunomonas antarctica]
MIQGIGTDILQMERARAALQRTPGIAKRVLTPSELDSFEQSTIPERFFAKRFAAKEAVVKALGTGIGRGVSWQHIEVVNNSMGKPEVRLSAGAEEHAQRQGIIKIHISYSDEQDYVVAFAIAESV